MTASQTERQRWQRETLDPALRRSPERVSSFTTRSGQTIEPLYTEEDVVAVRGMRKGDTAAVGRAQPWTIQQGEGYGLPEQANAWYRALLANGASALSVVCDQATAQGLDPDAEAAAALVGGIGVTIASLDDMERLFDGIRLDHVATSLVADESAPIIFAMYLVAAERQGVSWEALSGALQHDPLAQRIAQAAPAAPARPAMRLVTDVASFCAERIPKWQAVVVRGDRVRESGATTGQELAFALSSALEYVKAIVDAGVPFERLASGLSIVFSGGSDLFEEVAKYRAARRLWWSLIEQRYGAETAQALPLRIEAHTAGGLAGESSYDNVVRSAMQGLAAVLGGVDSLRARAFDEQEPQRTVDAATLAVRTQQVLQHESGVSDAHDPFAGSYYVETLTANLEQQALETIARIDAVGGMMMAIDAGAPQQEIASRRRPLPTGHSSTNSVWSTQRERLAAWRAHRDHAAVASAIDRIGAVVSDGRNVMSPLLEAVRVHATVGEMSAALIHPKR